MSANFFQPMAASTRRMAPLAAFVMCGLAVAQAQNPNDWYAVGYDAGGAKYSPLTQITPANVSTLKTAWTYDLGAPGNWSVTPLAVGNLYTGTVLAGELIELIYRNTVATAVLAPGVTSFVNINPR